MKNMDLDGTLSHRVGKDLSPRTPDRAYPYLKRLVKFFEEELQDVPHYYQGGLFIGGYTGEPRYTQDVDMTIVHITSYERVKEVLAKFGEQLLASGEISKYIVKPSTSERSSGGAKYYAPDGSILFSTDIGYHDNPLQTVLVHSKEFGSIAVTTAEQMLSDKLCAIYSERRERRIKDLYDAWQLISRCDISDIDLILNLKRHSRYPLPSAEGPFTSDTIDGMERAYTSYSAFSATTGKLFKLPDFEEIVRVIGNFCCRFSDSEV